MRKLISAVFTVCLALASLCASAQNPAALNCAINQAASQRACINGNKLNCAQWNCAPG